MSSCIGMIGGAGSSKARTPIISPLALILVGAFLLMSSFFASPYIGLLFVSIGIIMLLVRTPGIVCCMLNRNTGQNGKIKRCV